MQKQHTEQLVDYLDGLLSEVECKALELALTESVSLQEELVELKRLKSDMQALGNPQLSTKAEEKFEQFLAKAITEQEKGKVYMLRRSWLSAAAAIAILLSIATYAYIQMNQVQNLEKDLIATRTLMLELMQEDRTSARIKAANLTQRLPEVDEVVINNLAHMLLYDPDANVRLAALDALDNFRDAPATRDALLQALEQDQPEVVRFSLLHLLIELDEKRAIPYLEKWIETDNLSQPIKDLARLGRFKMI